ncbi:MAG: tRNA (adenosine(37)-N6)-threonylcarbamoyltransferase complex dimerization subunit type 1 TsaB [Ruminococcaceae bacterium]|nr:tRNA (adenosine(37)-N6)-threonylcarbamoyltransferase complex dimerization subunit type 1 TsaB [Oscillospiraceae bacterium]
MRGLLPLKNYKLLAADTSAKTATVALFENEVMLAEYTQNIGLTHSEGFLPLVEEVLVATKKDLSEIDYFAITNGPGSFTGLRIGVSTVKGLAHAVNKPLVEISTLDALAENIPHFSGYVCPILDARRQEVYAAVYKNGEKILADTPLPLTELFSFLKERRGKVMFLGDAAVNYRDVIQKALKDKAVFAPAHLTLQRASSVGIAAAKQIKAENTVSYSDISIRYLKASQPEQQLFNKQNKEK